MDDKTLPKANTGLKRFIPIGVILVALGLFFALGGPKYINFETFQSHRETLTTFVDENLVLTLIGFIALYAVLVSISFPGAWVLTVLGGFLFGTVLGSFGAVLGAGIGSVAIFLAARYAIGDALSEKAGPYMKKFETGLKENELSYLFILRLVPIFPFFIVNIVPALFNVKIRNYVISTFIGIIPGAVVYASIGNGVGAAFDVGDEISLSHLLTRPAFIVPVVGLIVLALIPIAYKKFRAQKVSS